MNELEILYEDNHLIVVVKPPNVLSQKDVTGDKDVLTSVKQHVKEKGNKPGEAYVGLLQRLDRPVGGIMIFAKTSKAASRINEDIRNHKVTKKYLAVVEGNVDEKGILKDFLKKGNDFISFISNEKEGKHSELEYECLEKKNNLSLIKIKLITGRHHQIRVQMSSHFAPIYGDVLYGSIQKSDLALWAYSLSVIHPITKKELTFFKYPDVSKVPWSFFNYKFK